MDAAPQGFISNSEDDIRIRKKFQEK